MRDIYVMALIGKHVERLTMAWVYLHMFNLEDGEVVHIDMLRGAAPVTADVAAVLPEHDCERLPGLIDTRENVIDSLGIIGVAFDLPVGRSTGVRGRAGVIVAARLDSPITTSVALEQGDLIHAVNGAPVASPAELRTVVAVIESRSAVVLDVERGGQLMYLAFEQP